MRHGSLFSGIGGFDLAAEWMGWENVFHCEINKFCNKVLNKYWPHAKKFRDIRKSSFLEFRGTIDILSGGFPCQPYSVAGKRKGKDDDRHLWPEMLRAIIEIQPRWIVGENVPGLINWSNGLVFDEMQSNLENTGYEVFPPLILPACGQNASHRRDRLWIIAHSNASEHNRTPRQNEGKGEGERLQQRHEMELINQSNGLGIISYSDSIGQQRRKQRLKKTQTQRCNSKNCTAKKFRYSGFEDVLPAPRIFGADDGLPNGVDRVKALGNSIVPQVVYQIFKSIEQYERIITTTK